MVLLLNNDAGPNLKETEARMSLTLLPWRRLGQVGQGDDDWGRTRTSARVSGVRLYTGKPEMCSVWPEEDEGGRN
jgi:hypothetical protein